MHPFISPVYMLNMSLNVTLDSKLGSLNEFLSGSVPTDSSVKAAQMLKNLYITHIEQSRSQSPTAAQQLTSKKHRKHLKLSVGYQVDTVCTTQPSTRVKVTPLPPISSAKANESMEIKKRIEYLK